MTIAFHYLHHQEDPEDWVMEAIMATALNHFGRGFYEVT
jgi:hypothetical protein